MNAVIDNENVIAVYLVGASSANIPEMLDKNTYKAMVMAIGARKRQFFPTYPFTNLFIMSMKYRTKVMNKLGLALMSNLCTLNPINVDAIAITAIRKSEVRK